MTKYFLLIIMLFKSIAISNQLLKYELIPIYNRIVAHIKIPLNSYSFTKNFIFIV